MADISIPGVKSRFDTEKTIEGLMEVERVPQKRMKNAVETLQTQKETWQALGRSITALRDVANQLYSYQNPFNDRMASSSNTAVLDAIATREARDQNLDFTVRQLAQADRFISEPLAKDYKVNAGNYVFSAGETNVSFKFSGGSLQEFSNTLNRRSEGKLTSSIIAVKPGTASLVVGSLVTGAENKLEFKEDALQLAVDTGLVKQGRSEPRIIAIKAAPANSSSESPGLVSQAVRGDALKVSAMSETSILMNNGIKPSSMMMLKFETSIAQTGGAPLQPAASTEAAAEETAETAAAASEETVETAAEQPSVNLNVISLKFTDGTEAALPAVSDSTSWKANSLNLFEASGGKTVASLEIRNQNTQHEIAIRNIQVLDPSPAGNASPVKALSQAQDAIIMMDGIEIERPSNKIDDLIPGLTLQLHAISETPVNLKIENNAEAVKDAVISLVGNYNRLMGELNVLTRNDERILNEITYLSEDEKAELKTRLGSLAGERSVQKLRSDLNAIVNAPYTTSQSGVVMLANFGITTDARRTGAGGYDPSRLRGYLEIDEKLLDESLANIDSLRELMGRDTDGDMIIDAGLAVSLTRAVRPFVEVGGVVAGKTSNIDTRVTADNRRIETIDRQLERKEADLKRQYGQMEDAYNRMERMTNSLDNFSTQNSGRRQ